MKVAFIHHPAANEDHMWPELLKDSEFLDWAYRVMTATSKEKDEAGFLRAVAGVGWQPPSWFAAIALFSREIKEYKDARMFQALKDLEKSTSFA